MGSFSKKTKTSSTTNSTGTVTPSVPGFIQQPAQDYYAQVRSLLGGSGPGTYGVNANQQGGFSLASGLGVNSGVNQAMGATRNLLNYTPDNVTAGQLRNTDLTSYLNPYTSEVIDRSMADLERGRQGVISSTQGAATQAGAYGGSRHGVADSLTNREFADSAGNLSAGLRQANFQNAQGMALADIANLLQAQTGNADRGVAGAGLRLGAANQLGQQGLAQDENTRLNAATRMGAGSLERDIAQQNDPATQRAAFLRQIAQLLGIDPSQFIGSNVTSSGQSSGTQTQGADWLGILGTLLQTGGAMGGRG